MFVSCPHCRDLVALDREAGLPPAMCPRCGGALQETAAADAPLPVDQTTDRTGPSLASLLRGQKAINDAEVAPELPVVAGNEDDVDGKDVLPVDAESDIASISGIAEMNALPAVMPDTPPSADAAQPVPMLLLPPPGPSFTRQVSRASVHPPVAKWQWAALVVLSILLVAQVLIADRARLAADAGWRPLITRMCGALGCSVPAWHQPGAFAMLSRDVRPIADTPGGLHVQATFRNDARWSQPWPVLLLSLSDADGRVLGARAFTPGEYLGATAAQAELAPGQSARIALQLREPNPNVVAFTFDFR